MSIQGAAGILVESHRAKIRTLTGESLYPKRSPFRRGPIASGIFPIANTAFPIATASLPIANGALPLARAVFPISKTTFPIAKTVLPIARGAFPIANATLPIAKTAFPVSKMAFPIANALFPSHLRNFWSREGREAGEGGAIPAFSSLRHPSRPSRDPVFNSPLNTKNDAP